MQETGFSPYQFRFISYAGMLSFHCTLPHLQYRENSTYICAQTSMFERIVEPEDLIPVIFCSYASMKFEIYTSSELTTEYSTISDGKT